MRRRRVIACSVLLVLLMLSSSVIFLRITLWNAESEFRSSFGKNGSSMVVKSDLGWAITFCGSLGKASLEKLSRDDKLSDEGHTEAVKVIGVIDSGEYLAYMRNSMEKHPESWKWEARIFQRCVMALQ